MAGPWVLSRNIGLRGDEICAICAYRTEYFVIKCLFLRFYASSEACLYLVSFCMTAFDDLFLESVSSVVYGYLCGRQKLSKNYLPAAMSIHLIGNRS